MPASNCRPASVGPQPRPDQAVASATGASLGCTIDRGTNDVLSNDSASADHGIPRSVEEHRRGSSKSALPPNFHGFGMAPTVARPATVPGRPTVRMGRSQPTCDAKNARRASLAPVPDKASLTCCIGRDRPIGNQARGGSQNAPGIRFICVGVSLPGVGGNHVAGNGVGMSSSR